MNLFLCAGTWGGTVLLFVVDPSALVIALGAVVVVYSLINLLTITIRVPAKSESWMSPVVGLISGILAGATGPFGAPIAIYMQTLNLEKAAFLQAVSLSFFITAVVWIAALVDHSAFDRVTTVVSLFAVIPAFIGMWTGQVLRRQLSEDKLRHWIFVFLVIVGANLIRKGIA